MIIKLICLHVQEYKASGKWCTVPQGKDQRGQTSYHGNTDTQEIEFFSKSIKSGSSVTVTSSNYGNSDKQDM